MGERVYIAAGTRMRYIHRDEDCRKLEGCDVYGKDRAVLFEDVEECSVCFGHGREQPTEQREARLELDELRTDGGR